MPQRLCTKCGNRHAPPTGKNCKAQPAAPQGLADVMATLATMQKTQAATEARMEARFTALEAASPPRGAALQQEATPVRTRGRGRGQPPPAATRADGGVLPSRHQQQPSRRDDSTFQDAEEEAPTPGVRQGELRRPRQRKRGGQAAPRSTLDFAMQQAYQDQWECDDDEIVSPSRKQPPPRMQRTQQPRISDPPSTDDEGLSRQAACPWEVVSPPKKRRAARKHVEVRPERDSSSEDESADLMAVHPEAKRIPPNSKGKLIVSGADRTFKSHITHVITWPSEFITRAGHKQVPFLDLSVGEFGLGFGRLMDKASHLPKVVKAMNDLMCRAFRDLNSGYQWSAVKSFVYEVFAGMEKGELGWQDAHQIREIRADTLYAPPQAQQAPQGQARNTTYSRPQGNTTRPQVDNTVCWNYNRGTCNLESGHQGRQHICVHCKQTLGKSFHHPKNQCQKLQKISPSSPRGSKN